MPETVSRDQVVVVPRLLKWHGRLAAALIYGLIRAVCATLREEWRDRSGFFEEGSTRQVIFCTWHNRLALSLPIYWNFVHRRSPGRRLAALVSASKDGALVARVLEHFGVQPVRGSTSRRGPQALLELTSWAAEGHHLAITPDGPRGPCYKVQEGIMALAQLTGLPIVPASYYLNWKIRLKSWDRFQIPLPFSRWKVQFGIPVYVPREASGAEREALRNELEDRMNAITRD